MGHYVTELLWHYTYIMMDGIISTLLRYCVHAYIFTGNRRYLNVIALNVDHRIIVLTKVGDAAIFVIEAAKVCDAPGAKTACPNSDIISIISALYFVFQQKRIEVEKSTWCEVAQTISEHAVVLFAFTASILALSQLKFGHTRSLSRTTALPVVT
jgi:hypothetical protein